MGDGGNHGPHAPLAPARTARIGRQQRPSFRRGRQEEAGASYLPPTAAAEGYGAPEAQDAYGGGQDDYAYDDYDAAASQASYGEEQVRLHTI